MEPLTELDKLRFAAILHDIGKFWQGAGEKGFHQELSAKFIRQFLPEKYQGATFCNGHHDFSYVESRGYKLLKILILSDWLSSGERKVVEGEDLDKARRRKEIPLLSIFSEVSLDDVGLDEPRYVAPVIYSVEKFEFPKPLDTFADLTSIYHDLWLSFCKELDVLDVSSENSFFVSLLSLLRKYTSFIPSAVWRSDSDVSLYDHLKTTCALADCLYKTMEEEQLGRVLSVLLKEYHGDELNSSEREMLNSGMFFLLAGDISGVQSFIYSIVSQRAAKALKGRSLYLELLTEAISRYIIEKLDLTLANLLYCAGGHFYILAPINVDVDGLRQEISEKLLEVHGDQLYLAFDGVPLSVYDLRIGSFSKKWGDVGAALRVRKKKKFQEILDKIDFDPRVTGDVCHVCGQPVRDSQELFSSEDVKKCRLCKSFEDLAMDFGRKYLIEIKNESKGSRWNELFASFGRHFMFSDVLPSDGNISSVITVNDEDFVNPVPYALEFKFFLSTSRQEFEKLAEHSVGLKRWGVLKGDVDNLGRIFSDGLGNMATLSRISTLSSMLSFFFEGWMNRLCNEFADEVYGIYSGGDDFFIVASWNILPELSLRIYEDFKKFTCYNPVMTLSIGTSISPSMKYPLYRMADFAHEELERAKNLPGKDAITFLGKPSKWSSFMKCNELQNEMCTLLGQSKVSKGFLQKLYQIYRCYESEAKKQGTAIAQFDDRYGRWRWQLAYVLSREKIKQKELINKIQENIASLDMIVRWVEFLNRGDES